MPPLFEFSATPRHVPFERMGDVVLLQEHTDYLFNKRSRIWHMRNLCYFILSSHNTHVFPIVQYIFNLNVTWRNRQKVMTLFYIYDAIVYIYIYNTYSMLFHFYSRLLPSKSWQKRSEHAFHRSRIGYYSSSNFFRWKFRIRTMGVVMWYYIYSTTTLPYIFIHIQ